MNGLLSLSVLCRSILFHWQKVSGMLYMLIDKFLLKLQTAIPPALIGKMSVQRIMERTAGESRPGHVVITY